MKKIIIAAAAVLLLVAATRLALWPADDAMPAASASTAGSAKAATISPQALLARGAYLTKAGDCMACHTVRGGVEYAGGRALPTPFGNVMSPNITPDKETGIGNWSADDFWRALHNGKAKDGRLLYPAFPYTNYTKVRRDDADALYAFFQSLPAHRQVNQPHQLRFPYNQQIMLAGWRALYFKPAVFIEQSGQSVAWNRGAYLVQGLGHCSACHSPRNALGATDGSLTGGLIPVLEWHAPALSADHESGLGDWQTSDLVDLLKTGVSRRATVFGPMAEVVRASLQHLATSDVTAMAVYLKSLPGRPPAHPKAPRDASPKAQAVLAAGAQVYETFCAECHQANGKGLPPHYPPLDGNRVLTGDEAVNPIRVVLNGGFAPGTAGNPRPYGMPAFGQVLDDNEVAAVVSYLRASWGNNAAPVTALQVNRYRSVPLD